MKKVKKTIAKKAVRSVAKTLTARGAKVKLSATNKPKAKSKEPIVAPVAEVVAPKKAAAPKAAATTAEPEAPHVEARLVFGSLSMPIDPSSLEHTLGAGRWGGGRGLVDQWPDSAWVALLAYHKLPADPLDRPTAEMAVKRIVQRLWYAAIQPWVIAERHEFEKRDAEAEATYKEAAKEIKEDRAEKSERAKTSFGKTGETKYQPTDALKKLKEIPKGQAGQLHAAFKAASWAAMTTAQAAEGMVKAGLKTATKPERIAAFYLCQWAKKGTLTRVTA